MVNSSNNSTANDVIQTLRTAHQNQTQLNLMADQKANILIGTLVLMFTVVLTRILALGEGEQTAMLVLTVFVLLELVPLVLTVLVLIPKNINGDQSKSISEISNPLFFGFFTQYSQQQYSQYMQDLMVDNKTARELIINDIYQIGKVLQYKYRLLRSAYIFALLGVMASVVTGLVLLLK